MKRDVWTLPTIFLLAFLAAPVSAQQITFQREVSIKKVVPHGLAFSPDGRYLAVSGTTGDFNFDQTVGPSLNMQLKNPLRTLVLLDSKNYKVKRQLLQEAETGLAFLSTRPEPMVFSADGQRLFTFLNSVLRVWDVEKGKLIGTWGRDFSTVVFSMNHRYALAKRNDGKYEAVDLQDGRSLGLFGSEQEGELLSLDGDRPYLAYLKDGNLLLKNLKTGEDLLMGQLEGKKLTGAALSHDARMLAVTSDSGAFALWSMAEKSKLAGQPGSGKSASEPTFSPDGSVVLFAAEGKVYVWGPAGPGTTFEPKHVFALRGVTFAADSRTCATVGILVDPFIKIWSVIPVAMPSPAASPPRAPENRVQQ